MTSTSPFLEMVRGEIRLRGYSVRTEKSYLFWIKKFILFHQKRHPFTMGSSEVKAFLTWLAVERDVAVNTQKVALNALVFLYQKVLKNELGELGFSLAKRQRRLPSVLTPAEVALILQQLHGRDRLIIQLLYGSGLRVTEALRLRVQDIDFANYSICVRDAKGNKDRQTLLSEATISQLKTEIENALLLQQQDNQSHMALHFHTNWGSNFPTLTNPQRGCLYFLQQRFALTQLLVFCADTIYTTLWFENS